MQGKDLGRSGMIRWNVTAAIVLSATALEANVNEHLMDEECLAGFGTPQKGAIKELLNPQTTLDKYQALCQLQAGASFDEGLEIFQDAKVLTQFRNAIVHFGPEWTDSQLQHARMGDRLRSKFAPSPFFSISDPLFPDRCMSSGCAGWCVVAALEFIQEFHRLCRTRSRFTDTHVARIQELLPNGA